MPSGSELHLLVESRKKKFKKLLIHGCVPITVDGTQKLYRDGLLQDEHKRIAISLRIIGIVPLIPAQ